MYPHHSHLLPQQCMYANIHAGSIVLPQYAFHTQQPCRLGIYKQSSNKTAQNLVAANKIAAGSAAGPVTAATAASE
jgi:hypothetical protein